MGAAVTLFIAGDHLAVKRPTGTDISVRVGLRSERVALLLGSLVIALERHQVVTFEGFARLLSSLGSRGTLNRKSMSVTVQAAQTALDALELSKGSSTKLRIAWPLRAATVGPWRLSNTRDVCFELRADLRATLARTGAPVAVPRGVVFSATDDEATSPGMPLGYERPEAVANDGARSWNSPVLPALNVDLTAAACRLTLITLVEADHAFLRGDYVPAAEALAKLASARTGLRPEGRAAVLLRFVRSAKRLGWGDRADAAVHRVLRLARQGNCADASSLTNEALTMQARLAYDRDPFSASQSLWESMRHQRELVPLASAAGFGRAIVDHSLLLALVARRRAEALTPSRTVAPPDSETNPPTSAAAALACSAAWAHCRESHYWAWAAGDTYNLQNAVANTAYALQCLLRAHPAWCKATLALDETEVLAWYALSFRMCRLFNLGGESAWDQIFVAEFWLARPTENWRTPNAALQEQGIDPTTLAFYQSAADRADAVGDLRQHVHALIGLWRFARHLGAQSISLRAVNQLNLRLKSQPGLRTQLLSAGYELPTA
jgi:hypothetical protein